MGGGASKEEVFEVVKNHGDPEFTKLFKTITESKKSHEGFQEHFETWMKNIEKINEELEKAKEGLKSKEHQYSALEIAKYALESDLQSERDKIRQLTSKLESQELQISEFQEESTKKAELKKIIESELETSKRQHQTEMSKLNANNENLQKELKLLKDHNSKLQEQLKKSKGISKKIAQEGKKLQKEVEALKEQQTNKEVCSEKIPNLKIHMKSLLDLNDPFVGWRFESQNSMHLEMLKGKEVVTFAVVGMFDVGKSWFCNNFSGKKEFNAGYGHHTEGLNFSFPEEDGRLIAVIDTPGSNEAIRVTDLELSRKIAHSNINKTDTETNIPYDEEYMMKYKILKNDAKMMQSLKECFIGEIADVVVVVCNKLSEKEQETVYKLIKHHKEICNERMKESQRTRKPYRETHLYVVHNYKMLTEIEQVQRQIQKDLRHSFEIKETSLFTAFQDERGRDSNATMFKDQFGIGHLILAAHGSEAGEYYNHSTFAFFKQKAKVMENRTSADVKKLFLDFCNKNIPKMLKQEDFRVRHDTDQDAIVRYGDSTIVLKTLAYDEFGDFVVSGGYEPRYSVTGTALENGAKDIKVEIEALDANLKAGIKLDGEGIWCLAVKGEKYLAASTDTNLKENIIETNREHGPFSLMIRLLKGFKPNALKKSELEKGIVQYTINFSEEQEDWI